LERSKSFHRKEKMDNYVFFMLEADVAKRRLAQLFESEGLAKENRSTATIACDANPAVRTGIKRDSKPFEEKNHDRGLVRKRARTALQTNQPGQVKRDLTVTGFMFALVSVCAVLAAYTDRPVFWLLVAGLSGIPHTIGSLSNKGRGSEWVYSTVTNVIDDISNLCEKKEIPMNPAVRRWLFIMPQDWTWWVWLIMACLLLIGLVGFSEAFLAALLLSSIQSVLFLARECAVKAFSVQLRLAYTLLLIVCFPPPIRWLYWLPALGTFALVVFGYCLMARVLSLLPWNRTEPITVDLLRRTFFSRPRLLDRPDSISSVGCGAGLCSIEA
jgi:hypothetical protein